MSNEKVCISIGESDIEVLSLCDCGYKGCPSTLVGLDDGPTMDIIFKYHVKKPRRNAVLYCHE